MKQLLLITKRLTTLLTLATLLALPGMGWGQSLLVDDYTGLTVGNNLAGQSSWTKGGSGPDATIGSASALTYANYNGGGAEYVIMPTASATSSRVYKGFTSTAGSTNTFYFSFLMRITNVSSAGDYFISLGDPTTGTTYFCRVFAKSSGAGFNIGISKVSTTATYGSTVYSLNTTHLVIVRYTYTTGATNDPVYIWVNPVLTSEPATGTADATISSGTDGPTNVGNFHWHNRSANNPYGSFDGVRVAYGATSAAAWTNLNAYLTTSAPTVTTQAATSLATTSATFNGNITSDGGSSITDRGFCYNTSGNVAITDNKTSEGSTGTGAFSKSFGSLSVNTQYYYRAYATNSIGTTLGSSDVSFYTLANVPSAPAVNNATISTLDVAIGGSDGNPAATTYAIHETSTNNFVQSDGTLGGSAVWQTAAAWGTKTVTGLTAATTYTFEVKARNGANTETAYGSTSSLATLAAPQIDWCNVQWPLSGNITLGDAFTVYAQVYEPGVTTAAGQGAGITAWIGYGTSNTDLSGYTWISASYNGDAGNNDEYSADLGAALTASGSYFYASRFKLGEAAYVYGGVSGPWNSGQSGPLTVNKPITWANLQHPENGSITVGSDFNVYARVFKSGITNAAGQGADITAWIGYNTSDTDPSTWTNWVSATFNADAGNNDEYIANIGTDLVAGTYYYASRFQYKSFTSDRVYGGYNAGGGDLWDGSTYISGVLTVTTPEPSAHVTAFSAATNSSSAITVTWTDSDAASYLIKGSDVSYEAIAAPVDGTAEANATLVRNVASGVQAYQFTGLNASTTYYFKIYPYNGSGTAVNYKTDGSVPEASATTATLPWVEDFETGTKGSYTVGDVTCTKGSWNLSEALIGTSASDRKNGLQSGRMRYSSVSQYGEIAMNFDKANGAGSVTIYHAKYGTDVNGSWKLQMSINGGSTWSDVGSTINTTSTTLTAQNYTINQSGNVRFKIIQLSGNRINIDDFTITNYSTPVFTGTGNWTETARWSNGSVPNASENVIIEGAATVNDVVACNNMTISSTGAVTVGSGQGLLVNGNLLIESDESGTGSFIGAAADYTIAGSTTVERYLAGYEDVEDNMFHLISSPVAAQAIQTEFVSDPPDAVQDFYKFDEPTNTWINTKTDLGAWNNGFGANFAIGKGYLVAYPTNVTKNFIGTLNSSELELTCTNTTTPGGNGWNLLGNPFPSAIDWDYVETNGLGTGMDNALYYYDNTAQNYRYYIQLGSLGSLGSGSQYIPAMQGFMVHAKTSGTKTVTLSLAARTHSGQNVFYKSTQSVPGSLSLLVTANGYEDVAFIHFNQSATIAFDGSYDAYKLRSYSNRVPMIFTKDSDGSDLAINGLPELDAATVIPVYLEAASEGDHTLTANLDGLPNAIVYLEDSKLGKTHNLSQNPVYNFTAASGDNANRFKLLFGSVGIDNPTATSIRVYTLEGKVYVNGAPANAQFSLTDITGRMVQRVQLGNSGLNTVNVSNLPHGVYVVTVNDGKHLVSHKIIL